MKQKINLKVKVFICLAISIIAISCNAIVVNEENEKEAENIRQKYSFEGTLFKMFICLEPSMKGEKLSIKVGTNVIFNDILHNCTSMDIGVCEILEIDNSGEVEVKINKKSFEIPSSKVLSYRFLIIKKEKSKYILKYTNYPRYL